jgi:hypothetical protein
MKARTAETGQHTPDIGCSSTRLLDEGKSNI